MMKIIQSLYVLILTPFYHIAKHIDSRVRNCVIGICCMCLVFLGYLVHKRPVPDFVKGNSRLMIIGTVFLLIIIIMSIEVKPRTVKWNPVISFSFIMCGIITFVASMKYNAGDGVRTMALLMMFGFPCLYLVWNNRGDYDLLFKILCRAIVLAMLAYFFWCYRNVPFDDTTVIAGRYRAGTTNVNILGMISSVTVVASMYLIILPDEHVAVKLLSGLGIGVSLGFLILSVSRASILAVILLPLPFLIFYVRDCMSQSGHRIQDLAVLGAVILIVINSTWLSKNLLRNNTVPVDKAPRLSLTQSVYADADESTLTEKNQTEDNLTDEQEQFIGRFLYRGDLDKFSSGRISLWKSVLNQITLWGDRASSSENTGIRNCFRRGT